MGTKGKVQVELKPKQKEGEVDEGRKFFSALNPLLSFSPCRGDFSFENSIFARNILFSLCSMECEMETA